MEPGAVLCQSIYIYDSTELREFRGKKENAILNACPPPIPAPNLFQLCSNEAVLKS